ncbi:MAG: uroporphyrinogen-III synthase [Acidobacteriota bacterium]
MSPALKNLIVVLTRAAEGYDPLEAGLLERGARVHRLPAIETVYLPAPFDDEISTRWAHLKWIVFTSKNGVRFFERWLKETGTQRPASVRVACVGPGTARAAEEAGWTVDLLPDTFTGSALAEAMARSFDPAAALRAARLRGEALAVLASGVDIVVFASPSAVGSFWKQSPPAAREALRRAACVPIGPTTAAALRDLGIDPAILPEEHSPAGILKALDHLFAAIE